MARRRRAVRRVVVTRQTEDWIRAHAGHLTDREMEAEIGVPAAQIKRLRVRLGIKKTRHRTRLEELLEEGPRPWPPEARAEDERILAEYYRDVRAEIDQQHLADALARGARICERDIAEALGEDGQ